MVNINTDYMQFRLFLVGLLVYLVLDGIWLGIIQKQAWQTQIQQIQNSPPIFRAEWGAMAYVCLQIFLLLFIMPLTTTREEAAVYGFMGGLLLYGVFDFTNLAIFHRYTIQTALTDMIWGGLVTAAAAVSVHWVAHGKD